VRIFIVDDDPDMVEFMSTVLKDAGHEVDFCVVSSYAFSKVCDFRPDCLITDLMMAELDGLEFTRDVKAKPSLRNTRIIMVSARTDAHWREEAAKAGAAGYITKPIDPETFAGEVEALCGD